MTTPNDPRAITCHLIIFSSSSTLASSQDYNLRTQTDARVKVHNILVVHAKAPVRHESPDCGRIIRAVDCVLPSTAESHGRSAHGIGRAAARDNRGQFGVVFSDRCRCLPGRLDIFAVDGRGPCPRHSSFADAYRITNRLSFTGNIIESALICFYDNRSRGISAQVNNIAGMRWRWRKNRETKKSSHEERQDTHAQPASIT